jgi:hypothetical protein
MAGLLGMGHMELRPTPGNSGPAWAGSPVRTVSGETRLASGGIPTSNPRSVRSSWQSLAILAHYPLRLYWHISAIRRAPVSRGTRMHCYLAALRWVMRWARIRATCT